MRFLFLALFFFSGLCMTLSAQDTYTRQASEVKGRRTVFTEILINASPEIVRAKFLAFKKWPEWNAVIPKIAIKSGDINNLDTKPTLDLTLDFGRKNDPAPAPVNPVVYENNEEVFDWGFKRWYLKANHVFIFEPINNGKGTPLVHYEKMKGLVKSFVLTKKTKKNMTERYELMNEALKKISEAAN